MEILIKFSAIYILPQRILSPDFSATSRLKKFECVYNITESSLDPVIFSPMQNQSMQTLYIKLKLRGPRLINGFHRRLKTRLKICYPLELWTIQLG